ncbi:MAG: S8 family serine peptidase, partial [Verrucomicrobia bacterium]|nr:S8 family serine peptidase [Verrucomicrobiota bacterium]
IYLKKGARPTLYDYVGDNSYSTNFVVNANVDKEDESGNDNIPAEGEAGWSSGYGDWYLSLVGLDLMTTSYDLVITLEMTYGDEEKAYYEDLASASEKLGEYYRYESGTSMAAAAVTGSLLLVQEFFETYAPAGVTTPSPALLKALLINGSNPAGNRYSRKEPYGVNYQGWGVPNMTNIIPAALTNSDNQDSWPLWFIDQSVSNALATGESWEQAVTVPTNFNEGNMKVTLVWTDPAGNPVSAIKLVNDLDLIVSNKVTKAVYVGNDFQVNSDYNNAHKVSENTTTNSSSSTGDTNTQSFLSAVDTARDFVNNVETVVIKGPLDTNYVISVQARRVNVNAVTAHKDGIVQDFALTVAFQSAPADYFNSTNKFEVKDDNGILGTNLWRAPVDIVTNSVAMLQQRVGANTPLVTGSVTNRMTNGVESQWHFYVFTNVWWTNSATPSTNSSANPGEGEGDEPRPVERVSVGGPNVAFATFLPPNMASPSRLNNADLDMYVSTNSALTNIDADVIAEAVENGWASRKQGGSELFYITNALENQVFYVGIKSEDQKAAEYGFVGISSQDPFDENDNGNHLIRFNPGSAWVPDGSADEPGGTYLFAIATDPVTVRSVFITNTYLAQNPGDLYVALSHSSGSFNDNVVVLHNHSFFDDVLNPIETNEVIIAYNDNGLTGKNVRTSDGPGSLMDFEGYDGSGLWLLTLVDNALNHTNRVGSSLYIVQRYDNAWFTLSPFSFMYHSFDVEDDVIAVNITISEIDPEYPLEAYILKDVRPTHRDYDYKETVNPPGRTITISRDDIPALETGRY